MTNYIYLLFIKNIWYIYLFSLSLNSINVLVLLTDLTTNTKLFVLILLILHYCFQKTISVGWLFCGCYSLFPATGYNIPLSNSLFLIHPILLLLAVGGSLYSFFLGFFYKNLILLNSVYMLAIFSGGLWAQQEFSWGGWWNWDFVELGIFLTWCWWLISTHSCQNKRPLILFFSLFVCFILFCACLNKWGVTISVHRFIQSPFFNSFYCVYMLVGFSFSVIFYKKAALTIFFILLGSIFYSFKEFLFLKIALMCIFIWVRVKKGSLSQRLWHILLIYLISIICLYNFFNFNFFFTINLSYYFTNFVYDDVFRVVFTTWLTPIIFLSNQDIFFFKVLDVLYSYELLISFFYQPLQIFLYYF